MGALPSKRNLNKQNVNLTHLLSAYREPQTAVLTHIWGGHDGFRDIGLSKR